MSSMSGTAVVLLLLTLTGAWADGPFRMIFRPPVSSPSSPSAHRRTVEETAGGGLVHVDYYIHLPLDITNDQTRLEAIVAAIEDNFQRVTAEQGLKDLIFNQRVTSAASGRTHVLLTIEADYPFGVSERLVVAFLRVLVHRSVAQVMGQTPLQPGDLDIGKNVHHQFVPVPKPSASEVASVTQKVLSGSPLQYSTADVGGLVASLGTEINAPWHLDRLDQRTTAYDQMYVFFGIDTGGTIYVIDTGVDVTHPEFQSPVPNRAICMASTVASSCTDCHGHGTHVSSLAGGYYYGVAKNSTIKAVQALDCTGSGSTSSIIAAFMAVDADASSSGADTLAPFIINLSLNGPASTTLSSTITNILNTYNVLMVAAAGNSAIDACGTSPAGVPGVFSIGASDDTDTLASFSNIGDCVSMTSPGVNIIGAWLNGQYAILSGTSMSSPLVAGTAAIILGQMSPTRTWTSHDLATTLKTTLLHQATNVNTLFKPLLFSSFDASAANNYGMGVTPTPATATATSSNSPTPSVAPPSPSTASVGPPIIILAPDLSGASAVCCNPVDPIVALFLWIFLVVTLHYWA